jgi:O-antigen ligase
VELVKARPWTGWGLGTWDKVYPAYATFDDGLYGNQAHCDWLQWPAEGGLPLLLIMSVAAAAAGVAAVRHPWSAGTMMVLLHAAVDYPMQQVPAFAALVWAMLALGVTAREAREE